METTALTHNAHWDKLDPLNTAYYELMDDLKESVDENDDIKYEVAKDSLINTLNSMYEVFTEWEQDFIEGEYIEECAVHVDLESVESSLDVTSGFTTDTRGYVESLKTLVKLQAEALQEDDLETLWNLDYPHWQAEAGLSWKFD